MKYIESFREGERVSGIYLCKFRQSALTKAGKSYENLIFQDKTGTIDSKIWDPNSGGIEDFDAMDYVDIVADVTTAISETENIPIGVYVSEVQLNSPAIRAGIQPGDIITSISGQPVTNQKDMMSVLLKCADGQSIQVVCERPSKTEYQELTFTVELKVLEK